MVGEEIMSTDEIRGYRGLVDNVFGEKAKHQPEAVTVETADTAAIPRAPWLEHENRRLINKLKQRVEIGLKP